jgi:hypothetical protein
MIDSISSLFTVALSVNVDNTDHRCSEILIDFDLLTVRHLQSVSCSTDIDRRIPWIVTREGCPILGVTTEARTERRVLRSEASRRARCGKSARWDRQASCGNGAWNSDTAPCTRKFDTGASRSLPLRHSTRPHLHLCHRSCRGGVGMVDRGREPTSSFRRRTKCIMRARHVSSTAENLRDTGRQHRCALGTSVSCIRTM